MQIDDYNILLRLKRFEDALIAYDHASQLDGNGGVSYLKGVALRELTRYEDAITEYDKALNRNPKFEIVWYEKGWALQNLNQYNEAIVAYDRALALNAHNTSALHNKSIAINAAAQFGHKTQTHAQKSFFSKLFGR